MSRLEALKKLAGLFKNPEDAARFLEKELGKVDDIKPVSQYTDDEYKYLENLQREKQADAFRRQLPNTPENIEAKTKLIKINPSDRTKIDTDLDDLEKEINAAKQRNVSAFAPAGGLALNPVDNLKKGYEGFENARGKLTDYLAKQTTGYLPEASKEVAEKQAKQVMNVGTDPLTYAGGAGALDVGLAAADVLPEGSLKRFKSILGK